VGLPKAESSVRTRAPRFGACALVAFWLATQAVATVAAQDAAYDEAQYQSAISQALDEFERGNWDEAEGLFAQAHRIYPNARTLRGIGISAFEARRYVRAIEHLQAALRSSVNPLSAEQRAEVERAIERAEGYVATVEISIVPADAEVRVNGELLAATAGARVARVDPGLVQVQGSAPSFSVSVRELRVAAGERAQLALQLMSERAAPIAPLDEHAVATVDYDEPPAADGVRFHAWKWLALGAGGLFVVAGGVAHVKRELTASDYNDDESCLMVVRGMELPSHCRGRREDMRDAEVFMGIGYGAGALLIGGAVMMFVLEDSSSAPSSAQAPSCELGFGAVRCLGHF